MIPAAIDTQYNNNKITKLQNMYSWQLAMVFTETTDISLESLSSQWELIVAAAAAAAVS